MSGLSTQKLATPLNASSADGVRLSRAHSAASSVMSDVTPPPIRLQTKLTVNTPGDKYEQEADRVADIVMRMPEPTVQRECETCGGKSLTGGECPECNKKIQGLTGTLQRLSTQGDSAAGMAAPPIVSRVLGSPGSPLPADTRSFMETRFGQDFSNVRVHTDSVAAESSAAVQAKAYTVGKHIAFGPGNSPSSDHRLLAHELTHVLQQTGQAMGTVQRYQIEGPWNVNDPVHEVLTLVAVREALSKLPTSRSFNADRGDFNEVETATPGSLLKDVKKSSLPQDSSRSAHNLDPKDIDRSAQQFVRGVVFPDDPKGLLFDDPKGTTDYSSGANWKSEFDDGKKGQFKSDKSDLIARSHFGDLQFFHGMASKDGESMLDTKRQILEWSDFLLKISTGELEGKSKIGDDGFASRMFPGNKEMTLNEFFGFSGMDSTALRQRAFGALSHMIQDSHAEGHTERDSKGEITRFHSYSSQDSHKHDEKDAWGKGKTLAEHIQNTPGAEVAIQQCAEVLIKIDQGESREAILAYLDTVIFKLSLKGTTAGPGKEFEKSGSRGQGEQRREVRTGGVPHTVPRLQPKLTVNTPGDKYEQEADRVAEQVMRMPEPQVQRQCACGKNSNEGECSECKRKKQVTHGNVQRVATSSASGMTAPPVVNDVLNSPGSPLPTSDRYFMESRLSHDFSRVRVHTDLQAQESAAAVSARAYTVGRHIVFGQGEHPENDQRLLAHELTHVVQQEGNATSMEPHSATTLQRQSIQGPTKRETCGDTVRWSSPEHMLIQQYYVLAVNMNASFEYGIPRSAPLGGKGYVDIIDFSQPGVFEIKESRDDLQSARAQLWRYRLYGSECPGLEDLRLGEGFPKLTFIPAPEPHSMLVAGQLEPGLIVYYKITRQPIGEPVLQRAPERVRVRTTNQERERISEPSYEPESPPVWVWVAGGLGAVAVCLLGGCEVAVGAAATTALVGLLQSDPEKTNDALQEGL